MNINIDSVIFIGFLAITVVVGLLSSRGSNTIKQYAVGDRNFSTATLVATIVATWIGGEFFYMNISEAYSNGLNHIWVAVLGDFFAVLIVGLVFAPRVGEFLGKLSIADAMGSLYGDRIRVITAAAGFVAAAGAIGVELKLSGMIFEYALGIPSVYGIIISTIIVTVYSSLGGVKSVTFTDIIQFFTFGVVIPVVAYALLMSVENVNTITNTLTVNPLFDYRQVFDFSNPVSFRYLCLFLFFIVPPFGPANFQRIAMARDTKQVRRSFIIAAFTCLFFAIIIGWIAILTLSINPSLDPNEVVKEVLLNSNYTGLKGAILAGIMAMIMSTVDSYINATSVLVVHDFCKPLNIKLIKSEIFSARIVSAIIGLSSLFLSLHNGSLLDLIIMTCSFYMPVVTVPFIMAILGFRSSEKSVLIGMVGGISTVIFWDYILVSKAINSVFLGMVANLIFLTASHYILRQKGGWVGIKDKAPLIEFRKERELIFKTFISELKTFSIIALCKKNCPKGEGLISILGVFVMISAFSSTNTLARVYQLQYAYLLDIIYPITLCTSAILISYPLWLSQWKDTGIIGIFWNIIMFLVLICFSLFMVLISNYSEIQLMVFMVNLIILSSLMTWRWSLFTIVFGVLITHITYQNYINIILPDDLLSSQFKIVYLLLLVSSILIAFLKPKQEQQELTEEKNEHLSGRIGSQEKQLREALALRSEFIRNVSHEYHAPMTGITSMAETLVESYNKLNDKQRLMAAENILKSSRRLDFFDSNLSSLSNLSKAGYKLNLEKIDFSDLIYERITICRKLYEENKEAREFDINIEEGIIIDGDRKYLIQLLDNLIINAIAYCKVGKITISLEQTNKQINFSIIDEGIGIPPDELENIFDEFTVSSKTRTPAGNRGVGLALCRRVAEVHKSDIKAESDGTKGAAFIIKLPL